jgi:hypothetical protein
MKISYAICVCNESKDIYSLISFLKKIKDSEDEINILVDSAHVSPQVRSVLEYFKDDIVQNERDFDGKFATHRNYHFDKCSGDYIFYIDPDEMPQEVLIQNLKKIISETDSELIYIPRINICPGFTQAWLDKFRFTINDMGWINWPDLQGRIFKNIPSMRMERELHEGFKDTVKKDIVQITPHLALFHIKSVEKQDNRWNCSDWSYISPKSDNLYDSLM